MNKYELYQNAYGNCPFWREWYQNIRTWELITLEEYDKLILNWWSITERQAVYPPQQVERDRAEREQKTWFMEQTIIQNSNTVAAVVGWSCSDPVFDTKLSVEKRVFDSLKERYDFDTCVYLAELFVQSGQQWRGLGSQLLEKYIQQATTTGYQWILTRTTQLKPNPMKLFYQQWFEKIYEYPTPDTRWRALFYKSLT